MKYRVILQERNREVYLIDAEDADDAVETVHDAIRGGFREALDPMADPSDGRNGCDQLTVWAEDPQHPGVDLV